MIFILLLANRAVYHELYTFTDNTWVHFGYRYKYTGIQKYARLHTHKHTHTHTHTYEAPYSLCECRPLRHLIRLRAENLSRERELKTLHCIRNCLAPA